jgi:hypothetical protein
MCFASNLIGLDLDRTANFVDPHLTEPAACPLIMDQGVAFPA